MKFRFGENFLVVNKHYMAASSYEGLRLKWFKTYWWKKLDLYKGI